MTSIPIRSKAAVIVIFVIAACLSLASTPPAEATRARGSELVGDARPVPDAEPAGNRLTIGDAELVGDARPIPDAGSGAVARTGQTTVDDPVTTAAYRALSTDDGGLDVRVARWTVRHGPHQLTTRIAVTNVDTNAADVLLTLYDYDDWPIDGCGDTCHATIASGATHAWWLADLPGVPDEDERRVGRALVRATGRVVVAVHEVPTALESGTGHDAGAYVGVAADAARGNDTEHLAPALLHDARLGAIGTGDSWVDVWNLHRSDPTTMTLRLQPQSGRPGESVAKRLEPGSGLSFDPFASVSDAVFEVFAGQLNADRPIAAQVRTVWPGDGGVAVYEGAEADTSLVLPLVTGAFVNRCSQLTIQSTNPDADVLASLGFYAASGVFPAHVMRLSVPRGSSSTISPCADVSLATALGLGFLGSLRVSSMDGETRFGVQTFLDVVGTGAVSGWVGQPSDQAALILFAPIVHSAWTPADPVLGTGALRLTSAIVITNATEEPIEVLATYRGLSGNCEGGTFTQGPTIVPGRGTLALEPTEMGTLPEGCLAAATIESTGGVLGVVYDEGYALPEPEPSIGALLPYTGRQAMAAR